MSKTVTSVQNGKSAIALRSKSSIEFVFVILFEQKSRKLRPVGAIPTITSYVTSRNFFTAGVAYIFFVNHDHGAVLLSRSSVRSKALR